MSDADPKPNASPAPEGPPQGLPQAEPFRRGQIVWGRPPQAVFRVGPLPRDEGLARLTAMPPHPKPAQPRPAQPRPAQPQPAQPQAVQPRAAPPTPPRPAPAAPLSAPRPSGVFSGSMVPRRPPAAPS